MNLLFTLIVVQALLGAFDNLWHHEITERLPSKRAAAGELTLHAAREFLYAFLFFAFAWYQWRGMWAALIATVLLVEVVITLADFIVEDQTRHLPKLERVLHTILAMNMGAVLIVLAPILREWWSAPTAVIPAAYGAVSWVFTVCSAGVLAWSVRNALAVLHHRRPPEWVRNPLKTLATPSGRTVLITGATGFIGGQLVRRLLARGDAIIVLTRDADRAPDRFGPHVRIVTDLKALETDTRIDAVVNLAGEPILGLPWTRARRSALLRSRIDTTRALIELIAILDCPPRVLIGASAVGYYGVRGDAELDERAAPQAIFQSELCQEWEAISRAAESLGVRVIALRLGLVLARDGGALPSLAWPVRMGLGAILGSGRQWMSWIHIDDVLRLFEFTLSNPTLRGAVNAVAPVAVTHGQFERELARTLRRPLWLRIPAPILRTLLGEMAQLLVDGQRVVPTRAVAAGFVFQYSEVGAALRQLIGRTPMKSVTHRQSVYYNGGCPLCRIEMNHYSRRCETAAVPVRFVDSSIKYDDLAEYGLRREHLQRRLYLKSANGQMLSGVAALISLWAQTPGYQWLSKVVSLPIVRPIAEMLYDHIAVPILAVVENWYPSEPASRGRILGS
jgi:uncharacterized protein (TIGR01777 family)